MKGVILANTGSPAAPEPDAIEAYLREYLMDERIRQLPKPLWKYLLQKHILSKRKESSAKRYRFIWTDDGSPLIVNMAALAQNVQRLYDAQPGERVIVRSAMSYGSPSYAEVLAELRDAGVDEVVLLPMYPQSSYSCTMAVVDAFHRALGAIGWHPESLVIDNYHDDPGYIAAIARSIRDAGYDPQAGDKLLLSFHAIPLKDEKAGDTYRAQIAETTRLLSYELNVNMSEIAVGFQSVFGHDKNAWTSPLATDTLAGWRDGGFRVVMACPGFAVDCLETMFDIPHDMVPALEGDTAVPVVEHVDSGDIQSACNTAGRFVWVPSLNATEEHAALVKGVIGRYA